MSKVTVSTYTSDSRKEFEKLQEGVLVRVVNDPGGDWKGIVGFKLNIFGHGDFFVYQRSYTLGIAASKYLEGHPLNRAVFEQLPLGATFTITQE